LPARTDHIAHRILVHLSDETEHVLAYLDQAAGQGLRKRNDIGTLLELAAGSDRHEEVNDLAFSGSFLYNLYQTLRKATPGGEGYQALEREFTAAVEHVRQQMAKILVDADDEHIERFEAQYYQVTQGSLRNVIDIAHDLGVLKSVQNEQKYGARDDAGAGEGASAS
jgi:hypothetical protein